MVGGMCNIVHTKPDIAFAIGYFNRLMESLTMENLAAVKHLLCYIAGTRRYGCFYSCSGDMQIRGFSDSNVAGDVEDLKSTTGVVFMLSGCPVTWQPQK
jgi:hypothetical protein